jgi:hypothetical protein
MITSSAGGNVKLELEHWPVIWLWPIGLVLMQMTLAATGDFSITIGVIACHMLQICLVMFYWLKRPPNWQVMAALVTLAYALAAGVSADDPKEFWGSFAHITNLVVMVVICFNARLGRGREIERSIRVFCVAASAAAAVIIAQATSFNLLHDFRLSALLGDLRRSGPAARSTHRRRPRSWRAPTVSTRSPRSPDGS